MNICKPSYVKYYLRESTGKSTAEVNELLKSISETYRDRWIKSDYSDFGIYSEPDYLFDMAHCYFRFTRGSISSVKKQLPDLSSILDFYNGIGLSTIQTKQLWPDSEIGFFNDVKIQKKWMFGYLKRFRMKAGGIFEDDGRSYEAVFLFEVLEHMEEPEDFFFKKIHDRVERYLIISAPFAEMWGGHFPKYHGIDSKKYKRKFKMFLYDLGYILIYTGFNGRPLIYMKGE